MAGAAWASFRNRRGWQVTVAQSRNGGVPVKHLMSAQLRLDGRVVHFERVDLREDGWEERLAANVAGMKQATRALEAAQRIAIER